MLESTRIDFIKLNINSKGNCFVIYNYISDLDLHVLLSTKLIINNIYS